MFKGPTYICDIYCDPEGLEAFVQQGRFVKPIHTFSYLHHAIFTIPTQNYHPVPVFSRPQRNYPD